MTKQTMQTKLTMHATEQERRSDARNPVDKPLKVRCMKSGRYLGGRTRNLSAGGALIEVQDPHRFVPGQRVKLGIAWNRRQMVLDAHTLIEAVVVRNFALEGRHEIAIQFLHRQEMAATG